MIIVMSSVCSCADEMLPVEPDMEMVQEQKEEPMEIDDSLYMPSDNDIFYRGHSYFSNLPGMVLVMDQNIHWGGVHLSYINKANQKEYYFCYDSLCDHSECDTGYAGMFVYPDYFVWSSVDQNLYALRGKDGTAHSSDGALYRFDLYTQEVEKVIPSNGNAFRSVYATDRYILLERYNGDSGKDIIRFDPLTDQYKSITPPQGRTFNSLYVAGETVLVAFIDDPYYYLTTTAFDEYQPTAMRTCIYLKGTTAYGTADIDGNVVNTQQPHRVLYRQDLLTGEMTTLYTHENAGITTAGFDGEYIYFVLRKEDEKNSGRSLCDTVLYRISVNGGEPEPMLDFCKENTGLRTDFYATQVRSFDGVLYVVLKQVVSDGLMDIYGVISVEDGQWRFDTLSVGDEP
ncbi:MAG: hypothetical protein IJW40_09315 [Clostridia bacterium]|nr:hypothetical protein [Clostridia bacterium]